MKTLITGNGLISKSLQKKLIASKNEYYVASRSVFEEGVFLKTDFSKMQSIKKLFRKLPKIDVIVHTAANPLVKSDFNQMIKENLETTNNLLESITNKDCKFIFCSSATVYGPASNRYLSHDESSLTNPVSYYGIVKLMCEKLLEKSIYDRNIKQGISLRLIANIGKDNTHGLVYDIINKLRSDSETLNLIGDFPGSEKPMMSAATTADIIHELIFDTKILSPSTIFNVGIEKNISVSEVANIIMDCIGINKKVNFTGWLNNWPGDVPIFSIFNQKIREFLLRNGRIDIVNKISHCQKSIIEEIKLGVKEYL